MRKKANIDDPPQGLGDDAPAAYRRGFSAGKYYAWNNPSPARQQIEQKLIEQQLKRPPAPLVYLYVVEEGEVRRVEDLDPARMRQVIHEMAREMSELQQLAHRYIPGR